MAPLVFTQNLVCDTSYLFLFTAVQNITDLDDLPETVTCFCLEGISALVTFACDCAASFPS